MPSPTNATLLPPSCILFISADLSSGRTSDRVCSIPSKPAIASALRELSPVIMTTDRLILCKSDTASLAMDLSWSDMENTAQALPFRAISMAVFPWDS